LVKPSDIGKTFITQDDSYDIKKLGEPATVIQINGPVKLKAEKLDIQSGRFGAVLLVAALAADGKSILFNFDKLENWFEDIIQKLQNLGAKVRYVTSD
jgi:UDP-N-acetylglucosamine 1-carboxyvinyltransferase